MSAIAGIVQLDDSPADERIVQAMVSRIAHRGPDGSGTWAAGPVALGHVLLQIAPESVGERQPLAGPEGAQVISFDGRIDNREDLWEALSVPPNERSRPDAELVLRAYGKWEGECPVRLVGEFTFALWDHRRRELFCARDAFGSREFIYHHGPRQFVFSSEIKAVLAVPGVPRRIDEESLARQLGCLGSLGERTLYEGIRNLPPAHSMTVRPGSGVAMRRYWQLAMEPELRLRSDGEYAEALRELIGRSVSAMLRCSHPVAVALSGGLDSSGVACIAARKLNQQGRRLLTVSSVLPDDFEGHERMREESGFIQAVNAQEPNMDSYPARGSRFPPIEFDDRSLERLGRPALNSFEFRSREVVAAAEERGARVLLLGLGGDLAASFDGSGCLEDLARRGRLRELLVQARIQGRAQGVAPLVLLKREVLHSMIPLGIRLWRSRLRRPGGPGWDGTAVRKEFAARMGLDELRRELELDEPPQDSRRHALKLCTKGWFSSHSTWAANYSDTIESPQPLMDRRIWEFAYRVPLAQFRADGVPRGLYRRALTGVVPENVLQRRTKGWFAPDYRQRMLACRPTMRAFLDAHPPGNRVWDYVDRRAVESVLADLERPGRPNLWNPSYQVVLGRGLRMAHFISWIHRTA